MRWTCIECGKDFRDKTDTRRHIEAKHTDHSFRCPFCPMKLGTRDSLRRHIRRLHESAEPATPAALPLSHQVLQPPSPPMPPIESHVKLEAKWDDSEGASSQ